MAKTKLKTLNEKNGVEKLEVTGFESVVPQIRQLDEQMVEMQEKRQNMKDLILNRVRDVKQSVEEEGAMYKSFVIVSEDDKPAIVNYKNQFSKLDPDNEEQLQKSLKDNYEDLFETRTDVKLKKNVNMDKLRELLGDQFDVFYSTTEYIGFKKNFMENRAALRDKLNKRTNVMLDRWTVEHQTSPDLRMKG
jgi:hypothetical protein